MTGSVVVKGSLSGAVSFPEQGLKGQVVVGAATPFTKTWTGSATVGSFALGTAPYYAMTSLGLGRGAIGLVPFHLYDDDCLPINRDPAGLTRIQAFLDARDPLCARFYGPVVASVPASQAVLIEGFEGGQWVNRNALFTVAFDDLIGGDRRGIKLLDSVANETNVQVGITYRMRPVLGGDGKRLLRCDLGLGTANPEVADFEYKFALSEGCYSRIVDYNLDDVVNPDDIGDFITDYFTVPPPPSSFSKLDVNYDGVVNPDDLGDFITAYFYACG